MSDTLRPALPELVMVWSQTRAAAPFGLAVSAK